MNEMRKMAHIHSKAQNLYQCCTEIFDNAKSFPMRKISLDDDDDNDDDEANGKRKKTTDHKSSEYCISSGWKRRNEWSNYNENNNHDTNKRARPCNGRSTNSELMRSTRIL